MTTKDKTEKVRKTICTTCFTFNPGRTPCAVSDDGRHTRSRWLFRRSK